MDLKLKTISKESIPEAISKAEIYRNLNEPEESESICHDILAVDPDNQRAITRFWGWLDHRRIYGNTDRPLRRSRKSLCPAHRSLRARIPSRPSGGTPRQGSDAQRPSSALRVRHVPQGHETFRGGRENPASSNNDDAMLRWRRCARLLDKMPAEFPTEHQPTFEDDDTAPIQASPWRVATK